MSETTEVKYAHLSNDLFWSVYHHDGDHFEKVSWSGYNDGYWWHNVAPTDEFLIRSCKCGKRFKLNIDERTVRELEYDSCPDGHPAVERTTDGMPVPCSEPKCTYYHRPISKASRT